MIALTQSVSAFAALPVTPALEQAKLLANPDPHLAANKKLAYDFFRVVLVAKHLDETPKYLRDDYVQHNPNVETGLKGFLDFFAKRGKPKAIPNELPDLVAIQAEGDYVTLSFVDAEAKTEKPYTTTWFDMFRIQDGKIAEHWDCDKKRER